MSTQILESLLPWDRIEDDERRFKRLVIIMLAIPLILSLVIPFVKVPQLTREQKDAKAAESRIVKLAMTKHFEPPKALKEMQQDVAKKEKPKAEEKTEKPKEEAKPEPKPVEAPHENKAASKIDVQKAAARENASQVMQEQGFDQLADLRDMDVGSPAQGTGGAGNGGPLIKGGAEAAGTSRSMLTSRATGGSGGLASNGYGGPVSSGFGGGVPGGKGSGGTRQLAGGLKGTDVKSNIGEGGPVGRQAGANGKLKRTEEEVRRVFDRFAGRLNSVYQRALRDDPNLQGSVTVKLTIAPDGAVTDCKVVSTQLNNADLEAKIVAMVRGFKFEPIDGDTWIGPYTLNFLPGG